jgi:hypothetical protein
MNSRCWRPFYELSDLLIYSVIRGHWRTSTTLRSAKVAEEGFASIRLGHPVSKGNMAKHEDVPTVGGGRINNQSDTLVYLSNGAIACVSWEHVNENNSFYRHVTKAVTTVSVLNFSF